MKKALVFFIALAMIGVAFADEPAAEVKVAEFKGDAAVTFGFDLDTLEAGFKNETSGSLKLNLLNGGDKSTTGDGIWGELKIKFDGIEIAAKADTASALNDKKVSIEVAKIHFGPVYMGIKSGDFDYGGDFWFPNALNYKDGDDAYSKNPAKELGYNQGFVLGYEKEDLFMVEASVRSKKDTTKKVDSYKVESFTSAAVPGNAETDVWTNEAAAEAGIPGVGGHIAAGAPLAANTKYYKRVPVEKDDKTNYWTNKFAFGVYGEVKPIKDLRIGVGAAYVLGKVDKPDDKDNANDISVFAGVDYRFNFNEDFYIQPTVAYNLYNDYAVGTKKYTIDTNKVNAGLRFGFAKSENSKDNSLLYDFFGQKKLFYEKTDNDKGDDILLPGVSVFGSFNLKENAMKTEFPVMVTFYSGDFVQNLKVYALFGANVAKDVGKGTATAMTDDVYKGIIGKKDMQAGLAASYDIMIDDITIVPAAGVLWTHGSQASGNDKMSADEIAVSLKADVKGLVSNTTFTAFWQDAAFGKGSATVGGASSSVSPIKKGLIGLKAKIAL